MALHSKIFTAFDKDKNPLYVYIGSANFTSAAWGSPSKKSDNLLISNYEIGVLLPGTFQFPYPYKRPPKKYPEGMDPWIQSNS